MYFVLFFFSFFIFFFVFFFNDPAPTEIYTSVNTLSLHDALPISPWPPTTSSASRRTDWSAARARSEEHTSELQSLTDISYAVFCLKKKILKILARGQVTFYPYDRTGDGRQTR